MKYTETWNNSDRQEGLGWVDNIQRQRARAQSVEGGWRWSDTQVTDFLLQGKRTGSFRQARHPPGILQPRQHCLQAWFLSRTILAPSCSDPVAATGAKQTSTPQPP